MTLPQLKAIKDYKLCLSSLAALLVIERPQTATLSTVSKEAGLSPTRITATADKLEILGYAKRRFGEDRRVTWLDITESGRLVLADIRREGER